MLNVPKTKQPRTFQPNWEDIRDCLQVQEAGDGPGDKQSWGVIGDLQSQGGEAAVLGGRVFHRDATGERPSGS